MIAGRLRPERDAIVGWGAVAAAALILFGVVRASHTRPGAMTANALILAPILAAAVAFLVFRRFRRAKEAREWTTLVLTLALVYGVLASFSVRDGALATTYLVQTGFTIGIFALLALGLSVQMGHAGLLNFGHVAFMGVGAYVVAIWTTKLAEPLAPEFQGSGPWATVMAILAATLAALAVYVPLLIVVERVRRLSPRMRVALALVPALVVGVLIVNTALPLDERGAVAMVVLLGVLVAIAAASVAGLLVGAASLRLREDYLAIVTLGAAEIFRLWVTNARDVTNGSLGILLRTGAHHMPITGWARQNEGLRQFVRDLGMGGNYALFTTSIVVLLVVILSILLLEVLARSPWGRVLKSIREDEDVAASLGKNTLLFKLEALMIGSALAALAGILFLWNKTNVYPTDLLPTVTFYTIAILVLGGIGNHKGALIGSALIWGIFEFAGSMNNVFRADCRADDPHWYIRVFCDFAGPKQQLLTGLVLILVILFRPQGAVGNKEELAHAR